MDYYRDYLQSPEWAAKRTGALMRAGYRCALCGSADNLNVHHLTYANLGDEADQDLLVLCRSCHEKWHEVADDLRTRRAALYQQCLEEFHFTEKDDKILALAELRLLGAGKRQNLNHLACLLRRHTAPLYGKAADGSKHLQRLSDLRKSSQLRTKKDLGDYVKSQILAHTLIDANGSYRFIPFDDTCIDWLYDELFSYYKGEEIGLFGVPDRNHIRSVTSGFDTRYKTSNNLCLIVDCEGLKPGPWSYTKCIHDRPLDTFPVPTIYNVTTTTL